MNTKINNTKGVILAGGRNSRFGSDKALAKINGVRTIDRIIPVMKNVFTEIIIITNNQKLYKEFKLKLFSDIVIGEGPLMGIYTALHYSSKDVFVTGCDMPFLNESVIRKIVRGLEGFDAAVPKCSEKLHYLQAAYSLRCFNLIKKKLHMRILGLKDLVEDLNCNIIEGFKFEADLFSPFFNMNTPDDFALVKDYLNQSSDRDENTGK